MEKGAEIYTKLIDSLADISKKCVRADWVRNGEAKGNPEDTEDVNAVLAKLTDDERRVLAEFVQAAYSDGIYDTLCRLEWYVDCKNMEISVEGEKLPLTEFEGLGNDFIGRREGWEWE